MTSKIAAPQRPLYEIGDEIAKAWRQQPRGIDPAAKPYLQAIQSLTSIEEQYGFGESGKTLVLYFLSNASGFRGEKAKALKAELKALVGLKR